MRNIVIVLRACFKQWFPQRNLIVVSEHKVKHIPISGLAQCLLLATLAGGVCWGAYSTGSYMAARMAIKAQSQALKTIAGARVATNFNSVFPSASITQPPADALNEKAVATLASPMVTLSALDNDRLFARVAFLEQRVAELQATNAGIIQRVRSKAAGRIGDLETIIRQVGLNPTAVKKEASEKQPRSKDRGEPKAEGGPYIPADISGMSAQEAEMYNTLDELATLQQVMESLPLSSPIHNGGDEQSPFGNRIDPFTGRLAFHSGLDLSGPHGTKVLSTGDGKVVAAGRDGAYGNAVDVQHGFGLMTRYAHLSQVLVKEGQAVKKGDVLGIQGSTGRSTGEHVHYEVRYNKRPMNPKNFLKAGQHVSEE